MKSRPRSPGIGPEFHLASFLEEVLSDDSLLDDEWTVAQAKNESSQERPEPRSPGRLLRLAQLVESS